MKKEDTLTYAPLIKAFAFALNQFRLYSADHIIAKQALLSLENRVQAYFSSKERLDLGSLKGRLVVDGNMAPDKDMAARDFAKALDRLSIEGLKIERGVEMAEMIRLVTLLAMRPKTLEEKGGIKKLFDEQNFQRIKISSGKFQLVQEGEVVAGEDETGAAGEGAEKPIASIADIIKKMREQGDRPLDVRKTEIECEKVVEQIEKNPKEIVDETLSETKDAHKLEVVIRKVVNFMVQGLASFLVRQGKDLTKSLDRLSKELEKALQKIGEGDEYDKLRKNVPQIFEEASDELRIQMMRSGLAEYKDDPKKFEKLTEKIFKDKSVRDRLLPALREELQAAGYDAEKLEGLFRKIEEKQAKKKKKVTVDAEELEDLKRKASLFETGGGGGTGTAELKAQVQKLEKEKKVISDQKERVETVIRHLGEGLMVVDKNGKVVLMNPAAERLLGMKNSEKQGRKVTEGLKDEHMVAMTEGDLQDSAAVSKNVETFSLNDETKKVLQSSTAVIENEDGKTVGMVSVLSDVTKQKELEEMKTKFVANVSHELRTPLVAIQKSLTNVLGQVAGEINEDQTRFLGIATRNIDRLSRLINDLLDVSKLEAQGMKITPKKISVRELVLHVLSTVETWAKDKKIKFETTFSDEAAEVEADSDRLTQVLTNLVGNAMKYTPESGSITVDVKSGLSDPALSGGKCIEIGVQDTGIGISSEDQAKIFDKFVQVSLAQPQGVSSTGLGLTISKEIIELHAGTIWVESEPDKGSRFAFRIPMKFEGKAPKQTLK